jgi:hypothetical protein
MSAGLMRVFCPKKKSAVVEKIKIKQEYGKEFSDS